jgi:hypothetical protein
LRCRPRFGSAWPGSEWACLVRPVRRFTHKFKMTSHFSAKSEGKTSSCIQVNKAHWQLNWIRWCGHILIHYLQLV